MAWWSKKSSTKEMSLGEISSRLRGFLLDSQIQHAHEISLILGCATTSEEVAEKEEEESEKRTDRISYLIPVLYAQASALAQGSIEFQRSHLPEEFKALPDEMWWDSRKLLEQISVAALMGSISQLVDMGLLEIPRRLK